MLGLAHDDDLVGAHHRHLAAHVDYRPGIRIESVYRYLVERALGLVEYGRRELPAERIYEVALVAGKQVYRSEPARRDVSRQRLVLSQTILEFNRRFRHDYNISRVIFNTFSVWRVRRNLSSARRPTSHTTSSPERSTNWRLFSAMDTLASIRKSLTFLRPLMPKGTNQSPCCQRRSVSGNRSLSASTRATLSGVVTESIMSMSQYS